MVYLKRSGHQLYSDFDNQYRKHNERKINMLTGKQKRFLRSKATQLKAIFQVGKMAVNENMLKQVNEALEKRELIKISILQNCMDNKETVAEQLVQGTDASLVQIIGNSIVLYKESEENKHIQLP